MSVAALSIAMSSFCTNPVHKDENYRPHTYNSVTKQKLIQQITVNLEDIIDFVQEDYSNGRMMTEIVAKSYIDHLLDALSKLEDLETINDAEECENCDEID